MEEGKEFALLPPPPRLFYSLSLSLSDLLHIISAWLDIWIFFLGGGGSKLSVLYLADNKY